MFKLLSLSFRDEAELRTEYTMAQRIYSKEVKSNLMANVEEEKKKLSLNLLQEENRLLAGSDNVQEKAIQYKSAGKRLPSVSCKNPSTSR